MTLSKKEKKLARRERQQELRKVGERLRERLQHSDDFLSPPHRRTDAADAAPEHAHAEVEYVLPDAEANFHVVESAQALSHMDDASPSQTAHPGTQRVARVIAGAGISDDDSDEDTEDADRVTLPTVSATTSKASPNRGANATDAANGGSTAAASRVNQRKAAKMSWQELKLAVTARYGAAAAELVGAHDGNSEDPFFLIRLKMQRDAVPVPRHWDRLRSFLSAQADREEAVGVVPAAIQALGVDKIRASKDKKADPNQMAFMTAFLTPTPLRCPDFDCVLSRMGSVYYEGKWMPRERYAAGRLSNTLRQALGMTAAHAPPPWLYSMQAMRRLPPAYAGLRIAGLNAPIPAGAQWGMGQGQWGEPPRAENNTFLFPGVMDEAEDGVGTGAAGGVRGARDWGVLPDFGLCNAHADYDGSSASASGAGAQHAVSASAASGRLDTSSDSRLGAARRTAAAAQQSTSHGKAGGGGGGGAAAVGSSAITPVLFQPQAFVPVVGSHATAGRVVSTVPQEYVRVQSSVGDNSQGTVAMGHVLVPKSVVVDSQQSQPPSQPSAAVGKQARRGV